jgi:uncharacterized protein
MPAVGKRPSVPDMGSLVAVTAIDQAPGPALPGQRLLDLQALDLAIDRLRSRRDQLQAAEEVREASERIRRAEAAVGELKLQLDEVSHDQTRLETDVDSMGRKVEAERARLYDGSVANAKELQSIEAEVAGIRNRISAKEDQLLELMERREELEKGLGPLEAELAEARGAMSELDVSSGRELEEIGQSLEARMGERADLASGLDPDLLELYEELRRGKKGVGAVALVDGVCQGCHQKLSPVYLERLKHTDGVRRCEYCRRIVVVR